MPHTNFLNLYRDVEDIPLHFLNNNNNDKVGNILGFCTTT